MNIDTERLKRDRAYWPEGAEAFFFMIGLNMFSPFFAKSVRRSDFTLGDMKGGFEGEKLNGDTYHVFEDLWSMIKRPEPAAEWDGDGLPLVGCECEFKYRCDPWEGRKCVFLGSREEENSVWMHMDGNSHSNIYKLDSFQFRPIRTKAEQEREWLIGIIPHPGFSTKQDIADAILKQCTVTPKDKDQ